MITSLPHAINAASNAKTAACKQQAYLSPSFPVITDTVKFGNTQPEVLVYDKHNPMPETVLMSLVKLVDEVFPGEATTHDRLEGYREVLRDEDSFVSIIQNNDDDVIACAFALPSPTEDKGLAAIGTLAVKEGARGRNIGGQILDATCEELQRRGVTGVYVRVKPPKAEDLERLRAFYERHQFEDLLGTILYKDLN